MDSKNKKYEIAQVKKRYKLFLDLFSLLLKEIPQIESDASFAPLNSEFMSIATYFNESILKVGSNEALLVIKKTIDDMDEYLPKLVAFIKQAEVKLPFILSLKIKNMYA